MKSKTFKQGGHIPHYKSMTEAKAIEVLPPPAEAIISLSQHIGAPNEPLVSVGDRVEIGQKVGESSSFVSAPVHTSVSGVVAAIEPRPHCSGKMVPSVVIRSEGPSMWQKTSAEGLDSLAAKEIIDIIKEAGIVGMGGAGFPTKVKLSPPPHKHIDTVILNGAECEPFLTADHRYMLEMSAELIHGIELILKAVGAERAVIGIEDNKPDAILHLSQALANKPHIDVNSLATKYPQGGEKQLIYSVTGREVPSGGLPMDVGVVVQNIGTAVAISQAVTFGKPLIERVVTVSGPTVPRPGNYMVKVGTPIAEVLKHCGLPHVESGNRVVMGGPMTGLAQTDLSAPVIKTTSGILVFPSVMLKQQETYYDCVRCGKCVEQCPMMLYPNEISRYAEASLIKELEVCHVLDCIECGLCSFVCPANRPIVQMIKLSKPLVLAQRSRQAGN